MDLNTWRAAAHDNLARLAGTIRRLAPDAVYGALSAATLLPVITASQQALAQGEMATLFAIGNLLSSLGINLLSNQLQAWRDRSQDELAAEINARVTADPALRDELATLLERLDVVPVVNNHLAEADRDWLADTLRDELARLGNPARYEALLEGSGAIAQGTNAQAATHRGVAVQGSGHTIATGDDNLIAGGHVIIAEQGATVVVGEAPVTMTAVDRDTALGRYLQHIIARNRYLQLQGIRAGGRLVHIELDRIFIKLRATIQRQVEAEERWLAAEAALAPGEAGRRRSEPVMTTETVTVAVEDAMQTARRLVVLGDPGSGKTTLLRYLALLYARDLAETGSRQVEQRLALPESGWLPILLDLRKVGSFLHTRRTADDGTEGYVHLLEFLREALQNESIVVPGNFFDDWLGKGQAIVLLDGMDEVADPDLRRRVARLVESFTQAFPGCRYVVTSRIVGYTGAARLGESYNITTVQDFSLSDVRAFLTNWHRLVAIGQMGTGASAEAYAADQTAQLLKAIQDNERIRELAINPLMLTVIAMVHRDRVKLPDRRAELYAEAVDVLLGKWEEAKGLQEPSILDDRPFDVGDKRLILQQVALHMHELAKKDIALETLRPYLKARFVDILADPRAADRSVDRFLAVIEERTGLLVARGEGVYAFSHLTFQEYLAALAVAARDDYVAYTQARLSDPWWREVVLLEAGYLSTQGPERTTRLIRAIADLPDIREPYHNLVLASECLRDVGSNRIMGTLEQDVSRRLRQELERPRPMLARVIKGMGTKSWVERRGRAMEALVKAGAGFWSPPYGEPEWIVIPAGEFWMGSEAGWPAERPLHRVFVPRFLIARAPITNAQYELFVRATDGEPPKHWTDGRPPKGLESHPVVNVTWDDAMAYCDWLGGVTGKRITLPSEAEWEKAARGDKDKREYPWGDRFDPDRCNSAALGLGTTTPVGIFPDGASPYGCLEMADNVWEWTRTLWGKSLEEPDFAYPYDAGDGREKLDAGADVRRVLRGGSWYGSAVNARCAYRDRLGPGAGTSIRFSARCPRPLISGASELFITTRSRDRLPRPRSQTRLAAGGGPNFEQ